MRILTTTHSTNGIKQTHKHHNTCGITSGCTQSWRLCRFEKVQKGLSDSLNGNIYSKEEVKQKLGKWVNKIVLTDSTIEDSNAIGESLVKLPEPKSKKL